MALTENARLAVFTIYYNPTDFPGKFVVRRWLCTNPPTPDPTPHLVADNLLAARASIPAGLVHITPSAQEDPVIVETWI